jgi:putative transcriptional regulator
MNENDTMKKTPISHDWSRLDAMSDDEIEAKALSDDEAQPLTDRALSRMKRTPQVRVIRRALKMTQEEFAAVYHIALGTLRDWEQNRYEPDMAAKAYLKVIAREPEVTRRALEPHTLGAAGAR